MNKRSHDVYLIDYLSGKRSGLELIKEPSFETNRAPVIFLTASEDEQIDIKAMETPFLFSNVSRENFTEIGKLPS